jgi:hypothetical protein
MSLHFSEPANASRLLVTGETLLQIAEVPNGILDGHWTASDAAASPIRRKFSICLPAISGLVVLQRSPIVDQYVVAEVAEAPA